MTDKSQSIKLPAPPRVQKPQGPIPCLKRQLNGDDANEIPAKGVLREQGETTPSDVIFKLPPFGTADAFDRTSLLLNLEQMKAEGIPLPLDAGKTKKQNLCIGFVPSKESYAPVTANSPMFAVDCEMVVTHIGSELARVTMVNESNEVVFDRLVKPLNPVEDYVTRYSGITKAILGPIDTQLPDVQRELRELLPSDAILVGHSIDGDLKAMHIFHPYLIDTSVIYNLKGNRRAKNKLKFLAEHFLGRMIQTNYKGHSSAEDARATMDLVRLKLSQDVSFGDVLTSWRFPEGYNEPRFAKHRKSALPLKPSLPSPLENPSSDNRASIQSLQRALPIVPFCFRAKILDLLAKYQKIGPPIHFCYQLLQNCATSFASWPLYNNLESQEPWSDPDEACPGQPINLASKRLAKFILALAQEKRYIVANVNCSPDWDESKRAKRLAKLCTGLCQKLTKRTLMIVVCAGPEQRNCIDRNTVGKPEKLIFKESMRLCYVKLTDGMSPNSNPL